MIPNSINPLPQKNQPLQETEFEAIGNAIQKWHYMHPGCDEFGNEYRVSLNTIDRTVQDDDAYTLIILLEAKREYRLLYGREWSWDK